MYNYIMQNNFEQAYKDVIFKEFKRHEYVLEKDRQDYFIEKFKAIINKTASDFDYSHAIELLSDVLCEFHGKDAIILIDDYDVPLEVAYLNDFHKEMFNVMAADFGAALKTKLFLMCTGHLSIVKIIQEGYSTRVQLRIPNEDVREIYKSDLLKCI